MIRGPVVVTAAAALAFAAPAAGAYRPTLLVQPAGSVPGQRGTEIVFSQRPQDDATAVVRVAVPSTYGVTLGQRPGTVIGAARVRVLVPGFDVGPIELVGRTVVPDLAQPLPAAGCGLAIGVFAVWRIELAAPTGQTLAVMLDVQQRPGTSGWDLVVCFPSPHVPEQQGGAPLGIKVVSAELTLSGVFTPPRGRGRHVWSGRLTPYLAGTSVRGTEVEARAIVPVPARVTIARKLVRGRRKKVALSGRLVEAGAGVAGARAELWEARNARGTGARRVARAITRSAGRLSFRRSALRTRWYAIRIQARDATARECGASTAPGGCVSARVAPAASRWLKVTAPKRR